MRTKIILSQIFSICFINLSSCIGANSNLSGFTKMHGSDKLNLQRQKSIKVTEKTIQYSVIAKLKSVNDQPIRYLEYNIKRFGNRHECMNWVSDNNYPITQSLREQLVVHKPGYFIDGVECLSVKYVKQLRLQENSII